MQHERLAKVKALLESDIEGEREAAAAAFARLSGRPNEKPVRGSPGWKEAKREWHEKVGFCSVHRNSHLLTPLDVKTIRNFARYGGDPWGREAGMLERIYRLLKSEIRQ